MFVSYLRISVRSLTRNPFYSLVNVGGLVMGISVTLLIGLWIYDELSFNRNYQNYDSIARVMRTVETNGEKVTRQYQPNNVGDELRNNFGDIFKHVVMAYPVEEFFLTYGETKLPLKGEFIESAGAALFTLPMIKGSHTALSDPHSILISESTARILFGDEEPMDKLLKINARMDAKVAGIFKDLPHNAQFHDVKFFAPLPLLMDYEPWMKEPTFTTNFLEVYVQLAPQSTFEGASLRIRNVILDNVQGDARLVAANPQLSLHPMEKWHLYAEWKNGVSEGGLIQMVWLFGIVGGFVLLLACVNFVNLTTARSEKRAKEVGIRKSIGSARIQLMSQFFSESLVMVALSFFISLAVVAVSLNLFNEIAGKRMELPFTNVYFWLAGALFVLLTAVLAGSYPALYLSSFNAIRVLKGLRANNQAKTPRQLLVVFQFTTSVVLVAGTVIVYQQIQYAKDRPVGYNREGLLMIPISPDFEGKSDLLRSELISTGAVAEMAESSSPPTDVWSTGGGFDWDGKDPALEPVFATLTVTPEYGNTVGWQFKKGRDFSRENASDSAAFVVNETAARILGFSDPIGQTIRWSSWRSRFTQFTVIGVIEDMVMGSPYKAVQPAVYFLSKDAHHFVNIKINPAMSAADALPKIEGALKKVVPEVPFDYDFASEEFAQKFAAEERMGTLAFVFAGLAVLISCLGLSGLASFVVEQRTKEIGIRKVVGATILNVWAMLSRDFVVLVVVACAIAVPIAYYLLDSWLARFEYRAQPSWLIFGATSVVALVVTLLTVSVQTIKAARANPVKSLRSE